MLGFVILGWPKREKVVGSASPGYCDNCKNQSMWLYAKTRRWVSLFFIPLIPLSRASHWLVCDICGAGMEIDKETARDAKEMVRETERCADGELPEDEYYEDVERFAATFTDEVADPGEFEGGHAEAAETRYIQ